MKFCLRLGNFKKTLIIPFLLGLSQILINIFTSIRSEDNLNQILETYAIAFSEISILIIPHIKYFSIESEKSEMKYECTKKNIFDYFLLCFIYTFDIILIYGISFFDNSNDSNTSIIMMATASLSSKEGIQIIFITLITILLLK